jgi:hypothetical protein
VEEGGRESKTWDAHSPGMAIPARRAMLTANAFADGQSRVQRPRNDRQRAAPRVPATALPGRCRQRRCHQRLLCHPLLSHQPPAATSVCSTRCLLCLSVSVSVSVSLSLCPLPSTGCSRLSSSSGMSTRSSGPRPPRRSMNAGRLRGGGSGRGCCHEATPAPRSPAATQRKHAQGQPAVQPAAGRESGREREEIVAVKIWKLVSKGRVRRREGRARRSKEEGVEKGRRKEEQLRARARKQSSLGAAWEE